MYRTIIFLMIYFTSFGLFIPNIAIPKPGKKITAPSLPATPYFGKPGPLILQPSFQIEEPLFSDPEITATRTNWVAGWTKDSQKFFYCIQDGNCVYQTKGQSKMVILENPEDREDEQLDLHTGEQILPLSETKRKQLQIQRTQLQENSVLIKNQNIEQIWPYAEDLSLIWKATNRNTENIEESAIEKFRKKHPLRLQLGTSIAGLKNPIFSVDLTVSYLEEQHHDSIGPALILLSPDQQFLGVLAVHYGSEEHAPNYTLKIFSVSDFVSSLYLQAGKQWLQQKNREKAIDYLQKAAFLSKSKSKKQEAVMFIKKLKRLQ